jgi:hypothetical protein
MMNDGVMDEEYHRIVREIPMTTKKKLLEEYLVELLKIDATIGDLLDFMADTIDEPWERGDGSAYDDIHVMSLYSDQGIRNLRDRILKEA